MSIIHVASVDDIVAKANRVGIIGYPGAGKTTLAATVSGKQIVHTDDYLNFEHDERPARIMRDLKEPFVVEGNEVTRLINRGLKLDALIMVYGSTRAEKTLRGLQGRVDKFIDEYPGDIYAINPRYWSSRR